MRGRLVLCVVARVLRCLDLGQPADKYKTNYERDREKFTGYAFHFQIPSTVTKTTASERDPLQQSPTDATDATSRAEW